MISVIIPTYNESAILQSTLENLYQQAACRDRAHLDVIVVDGGSTDQTLSIAQSHGVRVISTALGRAHQMNQGAAIAHGHILLFLHADTHLPHHFDRLIEANPSQIGAFRLAIDHDHWQLRWVEWGTQLRSKWFQLPYGDQGIFISSELFNSIGGYPDLPIMEDFALMRKIARSHSIALLPASVTTSARRWLQRGIWQTTVINQLMILGFTLGLSPQTLRHWYRSGVFSKRSEAETSQ